MPSSPRLPPAGAPVQSNPPQPLPTFIADSDAIAMRVVDYLAQRVPSVDAMEDIARRAAREAADGVKGSIFDALGYDEGDKQENIKDRMWIRRRREIEEAVVKQGIGAVILMLLTGLGTALVFWIKAGGK